MKEILVDYRDETTGRRDRVRFDWPKNRASKAATFFKATVKSSSSIRIRNTTCALRETASLF